MFGSETLPSFLTPIPLRCITAEVDIKVRHERFDSVPHVDDIAAFLNDDICYFITSYEDTDGRFCDTADTIRKIWSDGWAYMAVNRDCSRAYLETEYDISSHTAYFLKK